MTSTTCRSHSLFLLDFLCVFHCLVFWFIPKGSRESTFFRRRDLVVVREKQSLCATRMLRFIAPVFSSESVGLSVGLLLFRRTFSFLPFDGNQGWERIVVKSDRLLYLLKWWHWLTVLSTPTSLISPLLTFLAWLVVIISPCDLPLFCPVKTSSH